ncbi:MAG: hypothetical protein HQK49_01825 [Oligoflexia bacterium]|nr:hypothetical protein [Oligoflexia bacterium]
MISTLIASGSRSFCSIKYIMIMKLFLSLFLSLILISFYAHAGIKSNFIHGQLYVSKDGKTFSEIKNGDNIDGNNYIKTGDKSLAIIESDDAQIKIDESSSMYLNDAIKKIQLLFGNITIQVFNNKKADDKNKNEKNKREILEIKNKSVGIGIRGTLLFVSSYNKDNPISHPADSIAIKEGIIDIKNEKNNQKQILTKDESLFYDEKSNNLIPQISNGQWVKYINWNMNEKDIDKLRHDKQLSSQLSKDYVNALTDTTKENDFLETIVPHCKKGNNNLCVYLANRKDKYKDLAKDINPSTNYLMEVLKFFMQSCSENIYPACKEVVAISKGLEKERSKNVSQDAQKNAQKEHLSTNIENAREQIIKCEYDLPPSMFNIKSINNTRICFANVICTNKNNERLSGVVSCFPDQNSKENKCPDANTCINDQRIENIE